MSGLWQGLALSGFAAVAIGWCPAWSWWLRRHSQPPADDLMAVNDAAELETCEVLWALPARSPR